MFICGNVKTLRPEEAEFRTQFPNRGKKLKVKM